MSSLLIRWGAILVQGDFRRIQERTTSLDSWRLTSYQFPRDLELPPELPVGLLERSAGDRVRRRLTLVRRSGADPRLRVEDADFLDQVNEKESLERELSLLRRKLRRNGPDAAGLPLRVSAVESRLRILTQSLRVMESRKVVYELDPEKSSGSTTAGLTLVKDTRNALWIQTGGVLGEFRFPIEKGKGIGNRD